MSKCLTKEEVVLLEIERRALLNVVKEFTSHDCDARMNIKLNEFLTSLEKRADEIQEIINKNI